MGTISLPNLDDIMQIKDPDRRFEELVNTVGILIKALSEINGHVNSKNIFEVGGWRVAPKQLASSDGDVGFSTEDTAADDRRIWAGDAKDASPAFYVTKSGKMFATDGTFIGTITGSVITGGTVRTAASGARVELSNNSLKTYNSSNQLNGPVWGTDTGGQFGDTYFYHGGIQLMVIFDEITNYLIQGLAGSTGLAIGGTVSTTGRGTWDFSNAGSADMKGTFKVHSGTAFDTLSQSNSSAADVAGIVSDFNSLLSKLRSMNILA